MPKLKALVVMVLDGKVVFPGEVVEVTAKRAKEIEENTKEWSYQAFEKVEEEKAPKAKEGEE